jgi:myo-inositol-1-phosphate synthase
LIDQWTLTTNLPFEAIRSIKEVFNKIKSNQIKSNCNQMSASVNVKTEERLEEEEEQQQQQTGDNTDDADIFLTAAAEDASSNSNSNSISNSNVNNEEESFNYEKSSIVDGIGLWNSFTRNFSSPILAAFDLLDNAFE